MFGCLVFQHLHMTEVIIGKIQYIDQSNSFIYTIIYNFKIPASPARECAFLQKVIIPHERINGKTVSMCCKVKNLFITHMF